jgi:hypothetical protein
MRTFVLAMLLSAAANAANAQSQLSGRVLTLDSVAVQSAQVTLHDANGQLKGETVTDSLGGFAFRIGNATDTITLHLSVVRMGYAALTLVPVRVPANEDMVIDIQLTAEAVDVAPVTVTARPANLSPTLQDFYDKLEDTKRGVGRGLDRAVMQKYAGLELIKALQLVPGLSDGRTNLVEGVTLTVPKMRNGCVPVTLLDRIPVAPDYLATLDPNDLEGVLIYVGGSQIPPDFTRTMGDMECGLILAYRAPPSRRKSTRSVFSTLVVLGAFALFVRSAGW